MSRKVGAQATVPERQGPGSTVSAKTALSLDTADRRNHDVLAMLTHEIGNQLTVIQGFAEMLSEGIGSGLSSETAREFAECIVRNAKQMNTLLERVSEVRKLDQGTMKLQIVDVDLVALVEQAMPDLVGLLGDRPLALDLPPEAVAAADAVRVRQILANLMTNAAMFTPPGTPVTVTVTADDDSVELAVTDKGPGIRQDQRDQLFEKFSRLDAKVRGTGMGLYLARGIARAQAGDLLFDPQDRGCRFVLRLPRAAATSAP